MTQGKNLKRLVRTRMKRTGEHSSRPLRGALGTDARSARGKVDGK